MVNVLNTETMNAYADGHGGDPIRSATMIVMY